MNYNYLYIKYFSTDLFIDPVTKNIPQIFMHPNLLSRDQTTVSDSPQISIQKRTHDAPLPYTNRPVSAIFPACLSPANP